MTLVRVAWGATDKESLHSRLRVLIAAGEGYSLGVTLDGLSPLVVVRGREASNHVLRDREETMHLKPATTAMP